MLPQTILFVSVGELQALEMPPPPSEMGKSALVAELPVIVTFVQRRRAARVENSAAAVGSVVAKRNVRQSGRAADICSIPPPRPPKPGS